MTIGNTFNKTARELTKANRDKIKIRSRLYQEWIDRGYDRKMPFTKYTKIFGKRKSSWVKVGEFTTGRYQGINIGSIFKKDIKYIIWILENKPQGDLAKEIIAYCDKHPNII